MQFQLQMVYWVYIAHVPRFATASVTNLRLGMPKEAEHYFNQSFTLLRANESSENAGPVGKLQLKIGMGRLGLKQLQKVVDCIGIGLPSQL